MINNTYWLGDHYASVAHALNQFPKDFPEKFSKEAIFLYATKGIMSFEGDEWERTFASCINAKWNQNNSGFDEVVLGDCCWNAHTVKGTVANLGDQKSVRIISGRNSLAYSFKEDRIYNQNPDAIGGGILDIWNQRLEKVFEFYKNPRIAVLVRSMDYTEYLVFEKNLTLYNPEDYHFMWNGNRNLLGFSEIDGDHKFTWQPHGSQFTIKEKIPPDRLHIRVQLPEKISKEDYLRNIGFDASWYSIVDPPDEGGTKEQMKFDISPQGNGE